MSVTRSRLEAKEDLDDINVELQSDKAIEAAKVEGIAMSLETQKRIAEFLNKLKSIDEQVSVSFPAAIEQLSASELAYKVQQMEKWAISLSEQEEKELKRGREKGILQQ